MDRSSFEFGQFKPQRQMTGLQRDRIANALGGAPALCKEALIERKEGHTCARCAVAQLLYAAGTTDVALQRLEDTGRGGDEEYIWLRFGSILQDRYGFMSARQVGAVMQANDDASTDAVRERVVLNEVERMIKSGWR